MLVRACSIGYRQQLFDGELQGKIKALELQKKATMPLCTPETDQQIRLKGECRL